MNSNRSAGIANLLERLWRHLSRQRRRQLALLGALMLLSASLEVVSLGAVIPFLGVLVAPEQIFNYPIISDFFSSWGIVSAGKSAFALTIIFALTALIAGATRLLLLWASTRIAFASGSELSVDVYLRTLYQPYAVHVGRNSSEVISAITNKVNLVVFGVVLPLLILLSSTVLILFITLAMITIDSEIALLGALGFGASYFLITRVSRRRLALNSECIANEQTLVVKALQEGLGGVREVLLDGTQFIYCDIYRRADKKLRKAQGDNTFIGSCPRFAMEAIGMVLIGFLAYFLSTQRGGLEAEIPALGALVLGAQRLLPAFQQMYSSWASITGNHASLADTLELLDQKTSTNGIQSVTEPLVFRKDIVFKNVSFRYSEDGPWVLKDVNLTIPKGARIGFVGGTGSGKSTLFDLLMGLLEPTEGKLLVDGQEINGKLRTAWQANIAHVPQTIYLSDATVSENIAFGVPSTVIDMEKVREAANLAQIEDFIESTQSGYGAYIGERGIRLSGGQRQRIGIARALYKRAPVLVFDEATSALDNATEQSVMEGIEGLSNDLTIVMIAHRLTTLECCDFIVELKGGEVIAQGSFNELFYTTPSFAGLQILRKPSTLT